MKIDEWSLAGRVDSSFLFNRTQDFILALVKSEFFPWVCLVLVLSKRNWRKPIVLILVFHWLFRGMGDMFRSASELLPLPDEYSKYYQWPYTGKRWFVGNSIASVFWITGEIIGDWYLYLRTKAVIPHSPNLRYVFNICIVFNFVKVFGIYCHFMILPVNCSLKNENGEDIDGIYKYRVAWWSTIFVENIVGFIYDLSVIYTLKSQLFKKLKKVSNASSFLDKFKLISEFRIYFSMIISVIFIPFVALIVICTVMVDKTEVRLLNPDPIRQVVIAVNYTLMYIDQILLRCFMERTKAQNLSSYNSQPIINTQPSCHDQTNYWSVLLTSTTPNAITLPTNAYPTSPTANSVYNNSFTSHILSSSSQRYERSNELSAEMIPLTASTSFISNNKNNKDRPFFSKDKYNNFN